MRGRVCGAWGTILVADGLSAPARVTMRLSEVKRDAGDSDPATPTGARHGLTPEHLCAMRKGETLSLVC